MMTDASWLWTVMIPDFPESLCPVMYLVSLNMADPDYPYDIPWGTICTETAQ